MTKKEKNALIYILRELVNAKIYQESCYPDVFRFKNDPDFPFSHEFTLEQYHAYRVGMYQGLDMAIEYLNTYFC